jgi:hypothetical protein
MTIEQKCRAIYKGDVLAGGFYFFLGLLLITTGLLLFFYGNTEGYKHLGLGLSLFGILSLGKGLIMIFLYNSRLKFYTELESLLLVHIREEKEYTDFRLSKKARNRRAYIYITVIGMITTVAGAFSDSKSVIMGTAIPITLFAGIEFGVSLLTEFRLWEYMRNLEKL